MLNRQEDQVRRQASESPCRGCFFLLLVISWGVSSTCRRKLQKSPARVKYQAMYMREECRQKTLLTPPGQRLSIIPRHNLGTMHPARRRARRGQRKIVVDNWRSPLGPRRWARMGMVPRPGGGLSGLWARREEASPAGAFSPVHAPESSFVRTWACMWCGGHGGEGKIG
jgi:hypothetical protein